MQTSTSNWKYMSLSVDPREGGVRRVGGLETDLASHRWVRVSSMIRWESLSVRSDRYHGAREKFYSFRNIIYLSCIITKSVLIL